MLLCFGFGFGLGDSVSFSPCRPWRRSAPPPLPCRGSVVPSWGIRRLGLLLACCRRCCRNPPGPRWRVSAPGCSWVADPLPFPRPGSSRPPHRPRPRTCRSRSRVGRPDFRTRRLLPPCRRRRYRHCRTSMRSTNPMPSHGVREHRESSRRLAKYPCKRTMTSTTKSTTTTIRRCPGAIAACASAKAFAFAFAFASASCSSTQPSVGPTRGARTGLRRKHGRVEATIDAKYCCGCGCCCGCYCGCCLSA
mmetsp:Transcript_832/g.2076  ORF Transcript_832/g.2076 Transcript_832/m.2076 type:complete len:249 (+) Transcript_832:467-1213(+)